MEKREIRSMQEDNYLSEIVSAIDAATVELERRVAEAGRDVDEFCARIPRDMSLDRALQLKSRVDGLLYLANKFRLEHTNKYSQTKKK